MRIFMTGATGYIGGAVAHVLRERGHDVAALVRPDAEARHLRDLGVVLVSGDLDSLPSLADTLTGYDCFIHTAQSRTDTVERDRNAVETFTAAGAHFIYTSGVWVLGNTDDAHEGSPVNPLQLVAWRPPHEERALGAGGAVLRPGCVYGGKQSLCADWFAAADQKRATKLAGDGTNRWAMVDLHELADCYVRAAEQRATGVLHAIDDTRATLTECIRAVGDVQIETTPLDQARESLGPFADALAVDQTIRSDETRQKLGWTPKRTFVDSVQQQWQEWRDSQRV